MANMDRQDNSNRTIGEGREFERQGEEHLRMTIDGAGIGTWEMNLRTGAINCSRTSARLFGVPREALATYEDILALLHPEDRQNTSKAIERCGKERRDCEVDYRVLRPDGTICWLRQRSQVFLDQDNAPACMRGVILDVSKQKKVEGELRTREEHLRSILEIVPDAMIVIDDRGIIESFSAAANRLFGFTASETVGRNVSMLMPEPDRSRHDSYIARYRDTGEARVIGVGRVVTGQRQDDSTFPMHLSLVETRSGESRHFTGFVRDLTERQETQAKLQELQSELAHMSRLTAMGEMASTLAHELNQPLAAVSNYLNGCRRLLEGSQDPVTPTVQDALSEAAEQIVRAGQIIRHLRDFVARGETEKQVERVTKLIEEASALALVGARERGIKIRFAVDPSVNNVVADRVQVQQVLLNLLLNAIDAMQHSTRRELALSVVPAKDNMVAFSVSDTGTGVPDDIAPRLFEPFMTTKRQGMGVGLSISRTIVEAHGGRIWAEPNEGGGSIFHFTLQAATERQTDVG
ncbi:two-component system, LuxR family, sensor kinase FixL [Rhizobiales bacterium GAS113]|nr:two-component system, LuxR family, sensor kinase FixL [Rhizobiales bacterium GAS113]